MAVGKVYLVGAGPGDYKLITVKGQQCLQAAEVIVYDRLADVRLLAEVNAQAELIYVGKAASNHTMRQQDINQLLVDKARAGKQVVRLKGGDPFVFGRGGEEILELVKNNIPFEIVPGITSAVAVPAYAGIPVTHRGLAASFAVVTGHEDPTKGQSSLKWDKLAQGVDTLVFLMGVENLAHIAAELIKHGRPADTPAAVIRWGTKPEQQVLMTTVGRAAADAKAAALTAPAIFIVGEVVRLREELAWFDRKPLFGKKVLVTRAREQASVLTAKLEALGAECLEAPSIAIVPPESYEQLDAAIAKLTEYDWLIFTSVNGVKYFFTRLQDRGADTRALAGIKVAAIGVETANRLKAYGVIADIVPVEYRTEGIVEALAGQVKPGMKVLIPRAEQAREVLPRQLTAAGADVDVVTAYRTVAGHMDVAMVRQQLEQGEIDLVTFTSSSTVTNLLALLGSEGAQLLQHTKIACIGPITAGTCVQHKLTPAIMAEEYTITGLVGAIKQYYEEGLS